MKLKTFLFSLVILITANLDVFSQIEFELENGEMINGFIVENMVDSFKIKTVDNFLITIPKRLIVWNERIEASITTKSGEVYEGNITNVDDNNFYITTKSGLPVIIPKSIVEKVFLSNNYKEKQYAMFGPTFLLPGGINLLFGYHYSTFGVRGEFGIFPVDDAIYGFQMNVFYNLFRNKSFEHNVSIAGGYSHQDHYIDRDWAYIGVMYDFNIYGFFMEFGLTLGSGYYSNPQMALQLGYVYRFND
ncbi:MAG: hypothetical protein HZB41_09220 [Ignavibacteriae bacterium]|nr:hypothetical protein [Ignavibacteriota bacterium]